MQVLLDTHVWIWSQESPEKLGRKARSLLARPGTACVVSAISALELARLSASQQIEVSVPLSDWIAHSLVALEATEIEVTIPIAVEAYRLPEPIHKDPVDRILAATARILQIALITADERLLDYSAVKTIPARE